MQSRRNDHLFTMRKHVVAIFTFAYIVKLATSANNPTTVGNKKVDPARKVLDFLVEANKQCLAATISFMTAHWNYTTNINDETLKKVGEAGIVYGNVFQNLSIIAKQFDEKSLLGQTSALRQLKKFKDNINAAVYNLNDVDKKAFKDAFQHIRIAINAATICGIKPGTAATLDCSKKVTLDTAWSSLGSTPNYEGRKLIWEQYHNLGDSLKEDYKKVVEMNTKGAKASSFNDISEIINLDYEEPKFVHMVDDLYFKILPFYENLYTFVRHRLQKLYNNKFNVTMPVFIFGMLGQSWADANITKPFPKATSYNITENMINQQYDVKKMFHTADLFFQSLGMEPMPNNFWLKSMFTKPNDGRRVACNAMAYGFYQNRDYRLKMCAKVQNSDLYEIHHEMGHIQNYMLYEEQPCILRRAASPAIEEAIGDAIYLSARAPSYLQTIGLLPNYKPNDENEINEQMAMALKKIPEMMYAYAVEHWRYGVLDGSFRFENWNKNWWDTKTRFQGLEGPLPQRSNDHLDAGVDPSIAGGTMLFKYFLSYILQFQIYKAMCKAADHKGPLHQCNFYKSKPAGKLLMDALKLGRSLPPQQVLQKLTGQKEIDASALLEYFKPLDNWLTNQNKKDNECYGWGRGWPCVTLATLRTPRCPGPQKECPSG